MAYLHARSGIARSGVTYAGWTPPKIQIGIAGTNRSTNVLSEDCTLTIPSDSPATLNFTVKNLTPTVGSDVKFTYATPNDYWFGGTLLVKRQRPVNNATSGLLWDCTAVGYEWLLDRYDVVRARYRSTGVGTIAADILSQFTDGGFRVGYCPSDLGNIDMDFTFETVYRALVRVATAVGAKVEITPDRIVNIYSTYPDAAYATVTGTAIQRESFQYTQDLTQVRTRVLYRGRGTTAAAAGDAGATTLSVTDTGPFSMSGGFAASGQNLITYTSTSVGSGEGALTGVTGIDYDITEGDAVDVLVIATDSSAQTALATLLGGGLSGQATAYLEDGRLSQAEATVRGVADLATFGGALDEVRFAYKAVQRHLKVGRTLTLNIASPISVSGDFTIQVVQVQPYGRVGESFTQVFQHVSLSPYLRSLTTLLSKTTGGVQ